MRGEIVARHQGSEPKDMRCVRTRTVSSGVNLGRPECLTNQSNASMLSLSLAIHIYIHMRIR